MGAGPTSKREGPAGVPSGAPAAPGATLSQPMELLGLSYQLRHAALTNEEIHHDHDGYRPDDPAEW